MWVRAYNRGGGDTTTPLHHEGRRPPPGLSKSTKRIYIHTYIYIYVYKRQVVCLERGSNLCTPGIWRRAVLPRKFLHHRGYKTVLIHFAILILLREHRPGIRILRLSGSGQFLANALNSPRAYPREENLRPARFTP